METRHTLAFLSLPAAALVVVVEAMARQFSMRRVLVAVPAAAVQQQPQVARV